MYKYLFVLALIGLGNYAYSQIREEHIMLRTKDCDIQGTLMLPDGDTESVVLIVASEGPTDRDGNQKMMKNNAYKQYAHALAINHIATLRYDKRGVAASRISDLNPTETRLSNFVDDVKAWVKVLHEDNRFSKIIIAGHSEGALLSMAAISEGSKVDGFISLAGMGRTYDIILKEQLADQPPQIRDIANQIIDTLRKGRLVENVPIFLRNIFTPESQPYLISTFSYVPTKLMRQVGVPILIIHGDTDMQLKIDDAKLLCTANPKARLAIIGNMNHVLKHCPSLDRYHQADTYLNPSYHISKELVYQSVRFINEI